MTQGINEANKLYNEKMVEFNNQLNIKNNKLIEYKNKILVLKRKINEMYEELNIIRGNSSINNTSFFSTSFINNSIINTNPNQKPYEKQLNNTMTLNRENMTKKINKKLSGLIGYNSKTLDRSDLEDKFNSTAKISNKNKKKIFVNREIISPHIKKEILFPQTPQIQKDDFINNKKLLGNTEYKKIKTLEYINKNKEQEKNNVNFLKEYKEILEKFTNNINANLVLNKNDK